MLSDLSIRLRSLFRRKAVERELDEELRFHLEHQVEKHIQSGLTRDEAVRRARIEFGGLDRIKENCREARGITFIETVAQDVGYGLRMLRKSPNFTVVAILIMALGIGANTAIFSLVNAVLLRSLPVMDPQQLVVIQWSAHTWPSGIGASSFGDCKSVLTRGGGDSTGCSLSYPMFHEIRDRKNIFLNAMAFAGPAGLDLSGNGAASIAIGELVSGNYFETLGVRAALGRTLLASDDDPGAAAVAVLDYRYWKSAFGGSPAVVGKTVRLNNVTFTIVGVADPGFTRLTPGKTMDLWVPLTQGVPLGLPWAGKQGSETQWWLAVVGRLNPVVSRARAQAAVNAMFVNYALHGAKPVWKAKDNPRITLVPAQEGLTGIRQQFGEPLLLLMAVVGMVLLIACANVAGLLLARGAAREKEIAVRLAMGAGRRRVIRQLLTESLLLSFAGAAVGAMLAYWGVTSLTSFFSENAGSALQIDLKPNAPVLLFAIAAAALTGIGCGLASAFRGVQANISTELKGNSAAMTMGHGAGRRFDLGRGLVVLQVTLSMVVMVGAGLLLRTLDKLHNIDPGFDTRNILLFSIDPELAGYNGRQTQDLYENLRRRLSALPGVVETSYSSSALLDGWSSIRDVRVEGKTDKKTVATQMLSVGPDFFATMKIPLVKGRMLQAADMASPQLAAVVNRAFVRRFVGVNDPIGLRFGGSHATDPQWQIVGVVADTKYDRLRSEDAPTAYIPLTEGGATFALRTAVPSAGLMPAARNAVNDVDNNLPVTQMRTQSQAIDRLLFNERLMARLLGLFGALGLTLACIGLYGLLSYEVERHTREIGIRTALGAARRDILLLILRQGLLLVICGVVLGTGLAVAVTRLLGSLLYGVRPNDPATFAAAAAVLVSVAVVACSLPARRAARVDPMVALRCE